MWNPILVLDYLFWEAGLAAACLAVVVRFRPLAMRLPLFLGLHMIVSALSAAALSHAHWNSPSAYRLLAVALLAVGTILAWKLFASTGRHLARLFRPSPRTLAIWFALGSVVVLSIRPMEEGDSLYNLHYVMGWVNNLTTPYTFSYNYVPLWDLASVPALVLTRSDYFFWFQDTCQ
jgi:hypothetical protein